MPTTVNDQNGNPVDFPDGMSMDEIKAVMRQKFGGPQPGAVEMQQQQPPASQEQDARERGLAGVQTAIKSGAVRPSQTYKWDERYRPEEQGARVRDLAAGFAIGPVASAAGMPGDIEGLGRLGLSFAGAPVSTDTALPTSRTIGDAMQGSVGLKSSPGLEFGRFVGGFAGPNVLKKGAELGSKLVGGVGSLAAGLTTGSGPRAFKEAYKAGKAGGAIDDAFLAQMRGGAPASNVVDTAKAGLSKMRASRAAAYRDGIGKTIKGDPAVLDFAPVQESLLDTSNIGKYGDKTTIPGAQKVWEKVREVVHDWATSDPAKYHTPEGMDALKQTIGNLKYDGELSQVAGYGKPGEVILNSAYNAVKDQIAAQAPKYTKVMKDYQDASTLLHEIERTLSINPKATVDTSLRKLQSIMRNNVNTNYGARTQLAEALDAQGGGKLFAHIAGQSLNSWTPRGIMGPLTGAGGIAALATNPTALALAPLTSPRFMGEAAHAAGNVGGAADAMARILAPAEPALKGAAYAGRSLDTAGVTDAEKRRRVAAALAAQ